MNEKELVDNLITLRNDIEKTLKIEGNKCRKLRQKYNISIKDMANYIGYCGSALYSFENGKQNNLYIYLKYVEYIRLKKETEYNEKP